MHASIRSLNLLHSSGINKKLNFHTHTINKPAAVMCLYFRQTMSRYFLIALLLIAVSANAQQLSPSDFSSLKIQEDSLSFYAKNMVFDSFPENRFHYDSVFIRSLIRALKTPYSFEYSFDSVYTVSRLYAP